MFEFINRYLNPIGRLIGKDWVTLWFANIGRSIRFAFNHLLPGAGGLLGTISRHPVTVVVLGVVVGFFEGGDIIPAWSILTNFF